jgi:hypothetical protein
LFNLPSTRINPHNHTFLVLPQIEQCSSSLQHKRILILAFVIITADLFDQRETIRKTWANPSLIQDPYDMQVIFSIGMSKNEDNNKRVKEEAALHKDILQLGYIDSSDIMTAKVIGSFKWSSLICSNAHFIMRINENAVVNTNELIRFFNDSLNTKESVFNSLFHRKRKVENVILADLVFNKVVDREANDVVSYEQYNEKEYPLHPGGSFYAMNSKLAFDLYELSEYVYWPPFSTRLENVYMGMLSAHLSVKFLQLEKRYFHFRNSS